MSSQPDAQTYAITPSHFPAPTQTSSKQQINGVETIATRTLFSDKILITVSQNGRLGHWTHTPLTLPSPDPTSTATSFSFANPEDDEPSSDLLPNHNLTATTILGSAAIPELDVLAQTLATQVASAIKSRDAREERTVVIGTGLDKSMTGAGATREMYSELVGLVLEVL
ncbi:unnamed protein product [Periconia digitata]|uniref:Proteasome assembly chaperone 3 n=1 Tax=Periconia digitata TaxID=1303443 RepID=A0A9W4UEW1_9PLEO|nr:unnamed protein product [Periconia digitata]